MLSLTRWNHLPLAQSVVFVSRLAARRFVCCVSYIAAAYVRSGNASLANLEEDKILRAHFALPTPGMITTKV